MADIRRLSSPTRSNYEPTFAHNSSLGGDESELLGEMNQVLRRSHSRIDNLRKDVRQKDDVIKRERAMRRAAEKRELPNANDDSQFVDMYTGSTPSVQEELKNRLDPATQRAKLLKGVRPDRISPGKDTPKQEFRKIPEVRKSPKVNKPRGTGEGREKVSESLQSSDTEESSEYTRGSHRKTRKSRRHRDSDDSYWDERDERKHSRHRSSGPYPSSSTWYNDRIPYQPHPGMQVSWPSPHQYPPGMIPTPGYDPRLMHAPPGSIPTTSTPIVSVPQGAVVGPQGIPMANMVSSHSLPNLPDATQVSPTHTAGQSTPQHSPQHKQQQQQQQNDLQQQQQQQKQGTDGQQNRQVNLSPSRASETKDIDISMSRLGISRATQHTDKSLSPDLKEGVPILISELGTAKDINKDLAERLAEAEREVESLKLALNVAEATLDAQVAAKGAAVVEEVYSAQKERDAAVMRRLRVANDERDDAMSRMKRYDHEFDSGTDVGSLDGDFDPINNNASIHELLALLSQAETGPEIDKYGSAIVQRLGSSKNSKRRITSEEMRAILQEKDAALIKCKKLEREIIEVRRNNEGLSVRNGNDKSLKSQLEATRQEREAALAHAKKLKEELDSVKIYYSLHKSLSQEANLRDQFNNTLGSIEEQVKARDQVLAKTQQDNSQLAQQLKTAHDERNTMAVRLQQSEQARRQIQERCQQMERLVVVLRKKVTEGSIKTIN